MPRSRKTDEATADGPRQVCGAACCATARFEEVPAAADASIGVVSYDRPRFERGWHYHPEVELTLILESSGQRFVGDHIGNFEPGDLVLLGGNIPHVWRSDPLALPKRQRARSIYVHFRSAWLEGLAGDLHEFQEIGCLLEQAARGLCFGGPGCGQVAREMERLPGLSGMRRLLALLALLQSLAEAGGGVPLSSAGFSPVLDHRAGERIRKIHCH
ncbi:MAG: cupin domain-containing protein, partial [Verrucomicrobiota bacterium]